MRRRLMVAVIAVVLIVIGATAMHDVGAGALRDQVLVDQTDE
jgi:hypothetical protein